MLQHRNMKLLTLGINKDEIRDTRHHAYLTQMEDPIFVRRLDQTIQQEDNKNTVDNTVAEIEKTVSLNP